MFNSPTSFGSTTTISRFAKSGNGGISYTSRNGPIELDHLQRIAPSVFAESKHGSRSDRYAYIPTMEIMQQLQREGFRPYAVMQGGSRDEEKRGFTKHLLRLRHDSQALSVGGTHNEIVLLNSHDGTSSYRLMAGVFRLVCGNGMVVAQNMIEDIRVTHSGDVAGKVLDGCVSILDRLPEVSESIREMTALNLSNGEQLAFARAALIARYGEDEAPVTAEQVNRAQRREDTDSSLWTTLNRSQESLIRGGLNYIQRDGNGRAVARRKTREVKGVDGNTNLNRALWSLAEEMRKIKASA